MDRSLRKSRRSEDGFPGASPREKPTAAESATFAPGAPISAPTLLRIQRSHGNRAAQQLIAPVRTTRTVQRTITVGSEEPYDDAQKLFGAIVKRDVKFEENGVQVFKQLGTWINEGKQFNGWASLLDALRGTIASQKETAIPVVFLDGKMFVLVGTAHGNYGKDLSSHLTSDVLRHSTIMLEYPSLAGTGQSRFSSGTIGGINDKTQTALANSTEPTVEFLGADGRKAFEGSEVRAASLRHKKAGEIQAIGDKEIAATDARMTLVKYARACLKLDTGTDAVGEFITFIEDKWVSGRAPDFGTMRYVLQKTLTRVQSLAEAVDTSRRGLIVDSVGARFDVDNTDNAAELAYGKTSKAWEMQSIGIRERYNSELINFVLDGVCNVALFSEALATPKEKVVVAIGEEHVTPLRQLMKKIRGDPPDDESTG